MHRLKYLLISFICLLTVTFSYAETDNSWGIKADIDYNIPGKWHGNGNTFNMYRPGFGFAIGAVYNIPFGSRFYFEPGLSFFYDSYVYDDLYLSDMNINEVKADPRIHKYGIRVPLVAGVDFSLSDRLKMTVFTGPELNIALGGKVSCRYDELIKDTDLTDLFGRNGQRRVNCGWKIGIGFPIETFMINLEGSVGINDMLKQSMSFRENRLSLSVAYYF